VPSHVCYCVNRRRLAALHTVRSCTAAVSHLRRVTSTCNRYFSNCRNRCCCALLRRRRSSAVAASYIELAPLNIPSDGGIVAPLSPPWGNSGAPGSDEKLQEVEVWLANTSASNGIAAAGNSRKRSRKKRSSNSGKQRSKWQWFWGLMRKIHDPVAANRAGLGEALAEVTKSFIDTYICIYKALSVSMQLQYHHEKHTYTIVYCTHMYICVYSAVCEA
jgi:hypothetical protein